MKEDKKKYYNKGEAGFAVWLIYIYLIFMNSIVNDLLKKGVVKGNSTLLSEIEIK